MKTYVCLMMLAGAAVFAAAEKKAENENNAGIAKITEGNTAFAMDLYQQLKTERGNVFFSPYSLSTALAMVYGGARGQTADQMAQTLHFDAKGADFHENYGQLIRQFNTQGQKGDYRLHIANALWAQEDFAFLDSYLDPTQKRYDAKLQTVNFVTAADKATERINAWVEEKTEQKIKNLILPGSLDAATRLVLTNAIYFKGNWAEQFDKSQTREAPFYATLQTTVQVPMMHRRGDYKYGEQVSTRHAMDVKMQILEMPYKGNELSMIVLLPEERYIRHFEEELSAETLKAWTGQLKTQEVDVFLPKFKMTSRFELSSVLGQMGMPQAFSSLADFSGMTGNKDLFISQVVHKAYVDVNEEGTEAAAATGAMMSATAVVQVPLVFRADRPFIFIIKDNTTGSLLFIGRVVNPLEENPNS